MIRELHVYGRVKAVGSGEKGQGAQHMGIGKTLLRIAEGVAQNHGKEKIAVISGIGVREYYRKQGYMLKGTYMIKEFPFSQDWVFLLYAISMVLIIFWM